MLDIIQAIMNRVPDMMTAAQEAIQRNDFPPGYVDPEEARVTLPPDQREPEMTLRRELLSMALAESRDWSHTNLGISQLYDGGVTGNGCIVAICDTGIDYKHVDLADQVILDKCKDFTGSSSGFMDKQSHGTHCAGIVAARSDGNGIIGIAPSAKLVAVKVLSDEGSGASRWIANGIRHAADVGADIISLSLGGPSKDTVTRPALQYAISKGCWVVIAAGNDGGPAESYPGHWPESIAVAATDKSNKRASFSTIHRENDIAAPGVSIMSTIPGNRYATYSGTSMATPAIAGCLALYRGRLKQLGLRIPNQSELLAILRRTAFDLVPTGPDERTGAGLIDTAKMVSELASQPPQPPFPPDPGTPGMFDVRLRIDPTRKTVEQVVLNSITGESDMGKSKNVTAAAALDKEQSRLLLQQLNGFLKIFGGAYPRIKATSVFLDALTETAMWSKLWVIFESDPVVMASLTATITTINMNALEVSPPDETIKSCRQFYCDQGIKTPEGFDELAKVIEAPTTKTQAEKEKFRRGVAAALATMQMWSYFIGSRTLQGYINFVINMFTNHFDEVWEIEHPEDADPG